MGDRTLSVRRRQKSSGKDDDDIATLKDDTKSRILLYSSDYQLIFLLESASDGGTRYVNVYRDVMDSGEDGDTVLIDYGRLVDSLASPCAVGDETYRSLHRRARNYANKNGGQTSARLMALLVRRLIVLAVERRRTERDDNSDENAAAKKVNVVLTDFFDTAFVAELADVKVRVDAMIELRCGRIAQLRERFVTPAARATRAAAAQEVDRFWRDFRDLLSDASGAEAFNDVVVYAHRSKYDAGRERPDADDIVAASRKFVSREMARLQRLVSDVRAGHAEYAETTAVPAYRLSTDADCAVCLEAYAKTLNAYPERATGVPIILDAMLRAVCEHDGHHEPLQRRDEPEWLRARFDALTDGGGYTDHYHPVCVPHGNEFAQTAKELGLRSTDYVKSAVNVIGARWKSLLWKHPRVARSPERCGDSGGIVSAVKRRLRSAGDDDDVDLRLCVLGLNRLRSNLGVYRGERIGLQTLGMTKVTFRPAFAEPMGCSTMVQMLERESELCANISHAYFEPLDVMLVGFYDPSYAVGSVRSRPFVYRMPQRPMHARDYFDYFHGKKMPECFYYGDPARPCPTYAEETIDTRFRDGDRLTAVQKKWRFEPDTACLTYRSERYEIIRHVRDDDDDDVFRIRPISGDDEYYVFKSRVDNVIRFFGKMTDGGVTYTTEMSSIRDGGCTLRQSLVPNAKSTDGRTEECRRFVRNGRVIVEYRDKSVVTYRPCGGVITRKGGKFGSKKSRTRSSSGSNKNLASVMRRNSPMSNSSSSKYSVATTSKSIAASKSVTITKSVMISKSVAKVSGRASRKAPSMRAINDPSSSLLVAEVHSDDGTRRTVEFADGTTISTFVREATEEGEVEEDDWVRLVISGYDNSHPAYQTVSDGRPGGGPFSVRDLVSVRADDGGLELQLPDEDSLRIEATGDAVRVYRGQRVAATFGWNVEDAGTRAAALFERRDGPRDVTTVARVEGAAGLRVSRNDGRGGGGVVVEAAPRACFIVKRDMSGFRMHDAESVERLLCDAVAVRRDWGNVVALFAASGVGAAKTTLRAGAAVTSGGGYQWLTVPSPPASAEVDVPKLLSYRTFIASGAADYEPLLAALRSARPVRSSAATTPGELAVRVNVPSKDTVMAMMRAGHDDRRKTLREKTPSSDDWLSAKLAGRRHDEGLALEALARIARNDFIPYFMAADVYEPLRNRMAATDNLARPCDGFKS